MSDFGANPSIEFFCSIQWRINCVFLIQCTTLCLLHCNMPSDIRLGVRAPLNSQESRVTESS